MLRATRLLCKLQLCNLFGFNEARYTKDKKKKRRMLTVGIVMLMLGGMMCFYAAGLTAGLLLMGAQDMVAPVLAAYTSMMVIAFTIFRAGPVLFNEKTYESLVVLPVPSAAIITARFVTLYAINALLSLVMTVSSLVISAVFGSLSAWYCISMLVGSLIVPLIPMTVSMILGTLIHAATSRMKHRQLMSAFIMIGIVLMSMYLPSLMEENSDDFAEFTALISGFVDEVGRVFPPLIWYAEGVKGNVLLYLLFCAVSLGFFAVFALVLGKFFKKISSALASHTSNKRFVMKEQQGTSVLAALFKRELKRYFASSVYVMNTLVGFILCIIFAASMLFGDRAEMMEMLPMPQGKIAYFAMFLPGLFCALSPITVSSISLEGKHFWLVRSLPVETKTVVDAKLCVQLVFAVPTVVISYIFLLFAVRPDNVFTAILMLIIPLVYAFFSGVAGLWCNIKNPLLNWESEAVAVKQSNAVLMMMLISLGSTVVPIVACVIAPTPFDIIAAAVITLIIAIITFALYKACTKINLNKIEE